MNDRNNGANTALRDSRGRFNKGNPGRPRGSRNRATLIVEQLFSDGVEEIATVIVSLARKGDLAAAKLVMDRVCPPAKERPITVDLPKGDTPSAIARAQEKLLEAASSGELLPGEAQALTGILEARRRIFETIELEERLARLEQTT